MPLRPNNGHLRLRMQALSPLDRLIQKEIGRVASLKAVALRLSVKSLRRLQNPSTGLSEDELQAGFAKYTESNDSKMATSNTPAHSNRRTKAPMRGDIHPTVLNISSRRQTRSNEIPIFRAVCGKNIYERGDNSDVVVLRRKDKSGRRLEAVFESGRIVKEHSWLGIDLDQASYCGYSKPLSRYGYIVRLNKVDAGPELFFEFESIEETKDFCELLETTKMKSRFL